MEPLTPLRRSDRLRRLTPKAMGSSPGSSPGTTANVGRGRCIYPRSALFSGPGDQTDSDSSLGESTSPKSSNSRTEYIFSNATHSVVSAAKFPPKLYKAYEVLAALLPYSDAKLMEHVSLLSFSQRPTRPHSFPLSLTPTMRRTGNSQVKRLRHGDKRAH
jgi:hypothetical protein